MAPYQPSPAFGSVSQLDVQLHERVAHIDGGSHRPQGVVLVQVRHPEHRHERIADELLDGTAVELDTDRISSK